jgi:hypothetical protein
VVPGSTVEAKLVRECAPASSIDVDWPDAFAGKPVSLLQVLCASPEYVHGQTSEARPLEAQVGPQAASLLLCF